MITSIDAIGERADAVSLSNAELQRYSRHVLVPEVGLEGQKRLKAARALLVGLGGLGSPAAMYLAAAGVGRLGLVEFDRVDASNLQRQLLYGDADLGRPKLEAAIERLHGLNPEIELVPHDSRLTSANALEILADYDVVLDGADNFAARYLVNDACVLLGKPNVHGSIFRFEGQASVFWPPGGPCYRCLFPEPPPAGLVPSCAEAGVLGILPGTIGVVQATEAVKLILGIGEPLVGRLMLFDALTMRFREVRINRDPACPLCGDHPTITQLIDYEQFCSSTGGSMSEAPGDISVEDLKARLDRGETPFILDVRNPDEYSLCKLPGSTLVPLPELPNRLNELAERKNSEIVVHCKMGGRAGKAIELLRSQGFTHCRNLTGGIKAWAERVDRTMPSY